MKMNDTIRMTIAISSMFWLLLFLLLAIPRTKKTNYKKGQIDAICGIIKYELITHLDSTKSWELKKLDE